MLHPLARSCCTLLASVFLVTSITHAQFENGFDDDFPVPGLIGTFSDSEGRECVRVDQAIAFDWAENTPDPRISADGFSAVWQSSLRIRSTGDYVFSADLQGHATIEIDDSVAFDFRARERQAARGSKINLRAGFHDITIRFRKTTSRAAMRIFWEGPKFGKEPLNPGSTLHYREDAPRPMFQRGRELVEAYRCSACHQYGEALETIDAPALNRLTGNLNANWLVDRLMSDPADSRFTSSKMPHFDFDEETARALTAFVFSKSADMIPRPLKKAKPPKQGRNEKPRAKDSNTRGENLLVSVGCLGCHQLDQLGDTSLLSGGSFDALDAKRPKHFFQRWLLDPSSVSESHRMPQFTLADWEASDIANFLEKLTQSRDRESHEWMTSKELILTGQKLYTKHNCQSCHEHSSTDDSRRLPKTRLTPESNWSNSCVQENGREHFRYRFSKDDLSAIETFFRELHTQEPAEVDGDDFVRRANCLACHRRGVGQGNTKTALQVAEDYKSVIDHVALVTPPSLNSIGDKFEHAALKDIVRGKANQRRPWLAVRMPQFRFNDSSADKLASWFVEQDRISESAEPPQQKLDASTLMTVGPRLVTSNGFGCASCHAIGDVTPAKAPPNSRGPNLAGIGKYVRKSWFHRWIADPLRVIPRVEMPAIKLPVEGVLDGNLPQQIDAVWHVINLDGFRPPRPDPVRVVKHDGDDLKAQSHLLTDVLRVGESDFVKPALVGLANRHNVLFDLDHGRLAGWWIGDTAHQHTEGKSWFWEAGGTNLLNLSSAATDFSLHRLNEIVPANRTTQFTTELESWEHTANGSIHFRIRLSFETSNETVHLNVRQGFEPIGDSSSQRSGFRRTIAVDGVPDDWQLHIRVSPEAQFEVLDDRLVMGDSSPRTIKSNDAASSIKRDGCVHLSGSQQVSLDYTTTLPLDRLPTSDAGPETLKPQRLNIAPGFQSTQLAIPADILPTGFAWDPSGRLVLTDLKGRVFKTDDSDNDGLPDRAVQYGDELATPFGLQAYEDYVDVINKYALLRLHDVDHDGRAERTEKLASGWGHTVDYHDWAIGLPLSEDGSYHVAFACQQDDRSREAAKFRGEVVRLIPRQPTSTSANRFAIERVSAGHRFPVGIAQNKSGDIFVPDNQGNFNPFNELNHVVRGKRYGFINKIDRVDGFDPPLTPPAIDIPHPWTRSVNGICFLETPAGLDQNVFGPFEGHLVGCEYDTQRLIRMSLQKVGGTMQGAAYPLSYDTPTEGPPLLGPITCSVAPDGALFVGNIRESGWGAGQNTGNIARMVFSKNTLPAGIREIAATPKGFSVSFTRPVAPELASDPENFSIQSFTRVSTPKYGGDDQDNRAERIRSINYDASENTTFIEIEELRANYVYEFNLRNLTDPRTTFFPDRGFYTLREIPRGK